MGTIHHPGTMKPFLVLLAIVPTLASVHATQVITAGEAGVTIEVPDDWKVNENDPLGLAMAPAQEKHKKLRLHLTAYKGVSAEEALQRSAQRIGEFKKAKNQRPEHILSITPVTTKSGIRGQKAVVSDQGQPYLDRYYFERPDGRIFCVCVYHYGDSEFSEKSEKMILFTLSLMK